ncbi:MAG: hypothetical protein ACM339_10620 [Ignavibacteria bacterium]
MYIRKVFLLFLIVSAVSYPQFLDSFDKNKIEGWSFFTGDGSAEMDFVQKNGYATIVVDGTKDKYNVYWTIIKRDISSFLDMNKFLDSANQLRVEAKVRVHNAPRRLNMMVNTNRTTNFHIDLMEFDIPDTTGWHIISMTTKKFDARPGDSVYVQLDVTDYGLGIYNVDVDYYKADIVNINLAGPDKGELIPYHPPIPGINTFSNHLIAADDALINSEFPDVNFNDWHSEDREGEARILTVNGSQWAILKWDFEKYKNSKADGPGLLELTTFSVLKGGSYIQTYGEDFGIEFGKVRVIEILGGDTEWDQNKVTYNNFVRGQNYSGIFNEQMIYDFEPADQPGRKNFITISKPVLQRLLDGTIKGLMLRPLGALDASFYSSESDNAPRLHFNVVK